MITAENIFKSYPEIISVKHMQEMLHIGRNTAYRLLEERVIDSIRIGRTHKIPKISVIAYLNGNNFNN